MAELSEISGPILAILPGNWMIENNTKHDKALCSPLVLDSQARYYVRSFTTLPLDVRTAVHIGLISNVSDSNWMQDNEALRRNSLNA